MRRRLSDVEIADAIAVATVLLEEAAAAETLAAFARALNRCASRVARIGDLELKASPAYPSLLAAMNVASKALGAIARGGPR